jgi:hypothetical protein
MPKLRFARRRRRILTSDVTPEQRKEIKRRLKEIDEGTVEMVSGEVFLEHLAQLEHSLRQPKH